MDKKHDKTIINLTKKDDITALADQIKHDKSDLIYVVDDEDSPVLKNQINLKIVDKVAKASNKSLVVVNPKASIKKVLASSGVMLADSTNSDPYKLPKPQQKTTVHNIKIKKQTTNVDKPKNDTKKVSAGDDSAVKNKKLAPTKQKPTVKKEGINIPNFDAFRKKSILIGVGLFTIIMGWVVAFFLLPKADVVIRIQTEKVSIQESVRVSNTAANSDIEKNILKAQKAVVERSVTKKIKTTGEKQVGEKASGIVKVYNTNSSQSQEFSSGVEISDNNGRVFIAQEDFSASGASVSNSSVVPGSGTVSVVAKEAGEDHNLEAGTALSFTVSGLNYKAEIVNVNGGTTEVERVVGQSDVDDYLETLRQPPSQEIDAELQRQFDQTMVVLGSTNSVDVTNTETTPEVDEEAEEVEIKTTLTYSVYAVKREELEELARAKAALDTQGNEKLYNVDTSAVVAKVVEKVENGLDVDMTLTGYVGVEVDEETLAQEISGLRYSAVVEKLEKTPGIVNADVEFSPFWVNKAPKASRINIEIEVTESN